MLTAVLIAAAVTGVAAILIRLVEGIPKPLLHPDRTGACTQTVHTGCGYQAVSGWVGDVEGLTSFLVILSGVSMLWHHFNCHADHCPRLVWHTHDGHGHPICKYHHPHGGGHLHTIGGKHL